MSVRDQAIAGVRDMVPALVSLFPIAAIIALTAVDIGLTAPQVMLMSLGVYNGLAQAAMLELMNSNASPLVIVFAGVLINLRFLMYSASLASYFERLSSNQRLSLAYLTVDTVYALFIARFDKEGTREKVAYFVAAGLASWIAWQSGTIVGIVSEGLIPQGLNLQFAIPLLFIGLLVPVLRNRPSLAASVTAGGIAVLTAALPFNLGLLIGTAVGVMSGALGERRWGI